MSTLSEALQAHAKASAERIPQDAQDVMNAANRELAESKILEDVLKEGSQAPDFELRNALGEHVKLSELLQDGPVVLSFYRGGWCPYCNIELNALQKIQPELQELQSKLVAVSPQTPDNSLTTQEKNELTFEVLSDAGNSVARNYGLVFKFNDDLRELYDKFGLDIPKSNGNDEWELPLPATYVIDRDRTVKYAFVNTDYKKRGEPSEILDALKGL